MTPLSAYKLQEYDFDNQQIQRAELLVLSTLEWKMGSITPFSYMSYFINKFCGESKPEGLCSRVAELFMAVTKGMARLIFHRMHFNLGGANCFVSLLCVFVFTKINSLMQRLI